MTSLSGFDVGLSEPGFFLMFLPETYTLNVETIDGDDGAWLCLDDGKTSVPLARFVSVEAADRYKRAVAVAFAKAHQMGRARI